MSRNKGFSRLTKFLQPPKLVDGIFEVSLRLKNFGEGKRRKEFEEWYVEWRAEWHNYAKYDLPRE